MVLNPSAVSRTFASSPPPAVTPPAWSGSSIIRFSLCLNPLKAGGLNFVANFVEAKLSPDCADFRRLCGRG
jgi:hypothetical protein